MQNPNSSGFPANSVLSLWLFQALVLLQDWTATWFHPDAVEKGDSGLLAVEVTAGPDYHD